MHLTLQLYRASEHIYFILAEQAADFTLISPVFSSSHKLFLAKKKKKVLIKLVLITRNFVQMDPDILLTNFWRPEKLKVNI